MQTRCLHKAERRHGRRLEAGCGRIPSTYIGILRISYIRTTEQKEIFLQIDFCNI